MFLKKIKSLENSLLFRLTVLYTLAFTLLAIIGFGVFYYQVYVATMDRIDEDLLENEIEYYSAYLARSGLEGLKKRLIEDAEPEDPQEEFYRIIDFNGNVLAVSDMSAWGPVDITDVVLKLKRNEINHIVQTITLADGDGKARMITAVIGSDIILQIGETLEEADEYLEIFRNLFAILTGILIIASTFIGWYLAKRALRDMADVTQTAEEISRGSYDRRVELKGQFKEIEKLGRTFNAMLDRIQILLRSMKEINDNIAHDLRSPLARIRGIAEMTLTDEKSINDYKDMAVNTIEECDSLIEMINTMLDITEAEAGVNGSTDEEFNIVAVIKEACELFRPIADEKGIELTYSLPDNLPFIGSKKKMQRIVTNILENAIKYTPERGRVAVSAKSENGQIRIVFNDTGVGISDDDLPHIFERFYRCDRSRPQGGVGLGLSLAKAYTDAMNGFISVTSSVKKGSTFELSFVQ
ncbi:MAG: HAMP domain-containing sensor histidine kinase [Desulfobacterales bacterium]